MTRIHWLRQFAEAYVSALRLRHNRRMLPGCYYLTPESYG